MAQHHALGPPRGAAGVEHAEQLVTASARVLDGLAAADQRLVVQCGGRRPARTAENHRAQPRAVLPQRRQHIGEMFVDKQHASIRVAQSLGDLALRPSRIDRVDDPIRPRSREQVLVVFIRVHRQNSDPIVPVHTGTPQGPGKPCHTIG